MKSFNYEFRGEELTVVIDEYEDDPPTNSRSVEWHFFAYTPEEHENLGITDKEEEEIIEAIDNWVMENPA
jgi:hypothetical protein